jgi:hypothetical protein
MKPELPTGKTLFVKAGIASAVLVTGAQHKRTMRFHNAPAALQWCIRNASNMVYICQPLTAHN